MEKESACPPPTVYQWLRLNFGDKPAPDIASNAINILAKASQDEFPEAAKELQDRTYVDDIGGSRPTTAEAKQVTIAIDEVLGKGQFQIKVWHSNSQEVDQTSGERYTDLLGHRWDKQEDTFALKKDSVMLNEVFTKRSCLAVLAQVWDPIGLVAPATLTFRIDLQELWSTGYGWDDILPEATQQKWKENEEAINRLLTFRYDRKLKPTEAIGPPQVHGFADGGELGYGAAIFLRWKLYNGSYQCVPVIVKPFVAPLKQKTIPRLELLGCLALTRIYNTCQEALAFINFKDYDKTFWLDSRTVLTWIKTPPREFRPFVSVRVAEIQETVGSEQFRYIKTKYNPADALTRGIAPGELKAWMTGPPFLKLPETEWPQFQEDDQSPHQGRADTSKEMKTAMKYKQVDNRDKNNREFHAASVPEEKEDNPIFCYLLQRCSTFTKIRRVLAYVHRFVEVTRHKAVLKGSPTVQELKHSELQLLKWSQLHIDLQHLDEKLIAKTDDEGLIRAHGRLENARILPKDMRNPVVLPRGHLIAILLLRHLHRKRGHCGYKSLMHEARRTFWIIGLRKMAKAVVSKCVVCQKLCKKPLDQLMGQLPSLRVAAGFPPFSNTAMDMFGPLQIRLNRRTLQEAQVVIFTCTTTRAVHLELLTDKSSEAFLMAFRRFTCLRGHPNVCWSDCGSNFIGAQEYLREVMQNWDIPKIQSTLSEEFACNFKWQWNTPHASHQNGVVESLIKSVRQALNSVCKNQAFTEEQWRTFLAETAYMVNSRPLYPSSDDVWEEPPITPNDILIGQHNPPPQPEQESRVNPRHLLRSVQNKAGEFWACWMKYFAPTLLPRNKWFKKRENVEIGDLVLELNPNRKSPSQWEMALIVDTYPGKDGLVRKARIKTQNGEYDRPIHKLCVIATKQELNGNERTII